MPIAIKPELYPWISAGVMAWGIIDCFFGYRLFKITLAVMGGVIGTGLGQILAMALALDAGGQLTAMIIGGLVGAGLVFLLYLGAVFSVGFLFGAALSVLILANFNHMVSLLAGCVIGLICGFIAVKLQAPLMKLSTALLGSFRTILALAYFTNQTDWPYYLQRPQQIPVLIDNTPWMFPAILALAVVGAIAQFELGGSGKKKKSSDD